VYGEITETPKKKLFGIASGGKLSFSLSRVQTIAGTWVTVRAIATRRPDGNNQRPVETSGKKDSKNIAAPEGTEYIAYVDGSQTSEIPLK